MPVILTAQTIYRPIDANDVALYQPLPLLFPVILGAAIGGAGGGGGGTPEPTPVSTAHAFVT